MHGASIVRVPRGRARAVGDRRRAEGSPRGEGWAESADGAASFTAE